MLLDQGPATLGISALPFVVAYALGVGVRARRDRIGMLDGRHNWWAPAPLRRRHARLGLHEPQVGPAAAAPASAPRRPADSSAAERPHATQETSTP